MLILLLRKDSFSRMCYNNHRVDWLQGDSCENLGNVAMGGHTYMYCNIPIMWLQAALKHPLYSPDTPSNPTPQIYKKNCKGRSVYCLRSFTSEPQLESVSNVSYKRQRGINGVHSLPNCYSQTVGFYETQEPSPLKMSYMQLCADLNTLTSKRCIHVTKAIVTQKVNMLH